MKRSRSAEESPHGSVHEKKPPTKHRCISAATSSAVVDMNFSLQVAKRVLHVSDDPYKNVACSPLSIAVVLNILAAGSAGPTRDQLLRFLGRESVEEVNDVASTLAEVLKGDDHDEGAPDIEFANALWVDQRWRLKETFKEVLMKVHKTDARALDFQNKVDEVVKDANLWAEKKTKGLIKQIVSRDSITKNTIMILANALYFKGVWAKNFKAEATEDDDFYLLNGSKVRAPFMRQWDTEFDYGTLEGCKCKVLKMPYIQGERSFSMYIFLPDEKDGLPNLMENMDMDVNLFNDAQLVLNSVEIGEVSIPKFSFECDISLSEPMKELGLTLPFDKESCDLTEIVEDTITRDKPYVSEVCQKCRVEINEQGTKAASLTIVELEEEEGECDDILPPPIDFVADHPFMFIIREDYSGAILFVGTILDPTSC